VCLLVLLRTVRRWEYSKLSLCALYLCYDGFLGERDENAELSGGACTDLSAWSLALARCLN
jgi:hypothetical protein